MEWVKGSVITSYLLFAILGLMFIGLWFKVDKTERLYYRFIDNNTWYEVFVKETKREIKKYNYKKINGKHYRWNDSLLNIKIYTAGKKIDEGYFMVPGKMEEW